MFEIPFDRLISFGPREFSVDADSIGFDPECAVVGVVDEDEDITLFRRSDGDSRTLVFKDYLGRKLSIVNG